MTVEVRRFRECLPEEVCLEALMDLRYGGRSLACPACRQHHRFVAAAKRRAFACEGCGHALYPAKGTPFSTLRTPLSDWFFAVALMRENGSLARLIERRAGIPAPAAERMARDLTEFAAQSKADGPFAGWIETIHALIERRLSGTTPPKAATAGTAHPTSLAAPVANTGPAKGRARASLILTLAAILGAGLGTTGAVLLIRPAAVPDAEETYAPSLSAAAPRPSLTLEAVEEDLAAAKATVEAVTQVPEPPRRPTEQMPAPRPADPPVASTGDPNEVLTFGPIKVRRHLVETIVRASRIVGADPTLLMAVADKESSFATEVKAKTSSATGLFQFIERTWLGVLAEFGAKHGYDREAKSIVRVNGQWTVPDPAERARILELRREPFISALMAGEMLRRDTLRIERKLGRYLTGGEIYLVHFLGPDGAQTFIDQVDDNPDTVAAELLPKPAEANKSIFYDANGGKSVSEVHKQFEKMITTRLDRYREVRRLAATLGKPQVRATP